MIRRTQIDFGKTDAKSAMVTRDKAAKQLFLNSFAMPHSIEIESLLNGDRYLIYGAKGSGKTALLRYLREEEITKGNATKFIVFSEDISQNEFDRVAKSIDVDTILTPDIENQINVRDMWKIFLIKNICDLLENSGKLFDDKISNSRLRALVEGVFEDSPNLLQRLSSSVKTGSFRIKAGVKEYAEFEPIINIENNDGTVEINYGAFSEAVIERICKLDYAVDVKFCLYIDEINLSMLQQKQHKKDSILIRDLILSIGTLNRIFVERNVPIYIYGAVRVEVAKGLNVSRNEIDKYLVDHGQRLQWHEGFEVEKYPIFEIIEQRISAIEEKENFKPSKPAEVWSTYFPRDVYGVSPKRFISEVTWCNPRDIVNLFNLASKAHINRPRYDTEVFSTIAENYSEVAWSERAEELNAEHSMTVVNAIRRALSKFHNHFKVEVLDKHAEDLSRTVPVLAQIRSTIGIEKVCRDLYHVGILGQSFPISQRKRDPLELGRTQIHETWFYRDNRDFDPSLWLIVHRALFPALKLSPWKASVFGLDPRMANTDASY